MNQLAMNERLKLVATTLNTVAISFIVTGFVVPIISGVYGSVTVSHHPLWGVATAAWILVAGHLHLLSLWILGGVK